MDKDSILRRAEEVNGRKSLFSALTSGRDAGILS